MVEDAEREEAVTDPMPDAPRTVTLPLVDRLETHAAMHARMIGGSDRTSGLCREAAAEIERLRAALETIEAAHVPDQPMTSPVDEVAWVQRHVGTLRRIAREALRP